VVFVSTCGLDNNGVHVEQNTWVRATIVFVNGWLEVLRVSHGPEML
jgi:hypothetical protein